MILHYDIADVASYINWTYFYFAWQLKDPDEQQRLRAEAERLLADCEGTYHTHAIVELADAYSDGDDIVVSSTAWQGPRRLPFLRQQQADSDHLCLADFIAPEGYGSPIGNRLALFATSTDGAMATDFDADPYRKLMAQLVRNGPAEFRRVPHLFKRQDQFILCSPDPGSALFFRFSVHDRLRTSLSVHSIVFRAGRDRSVCRPSRYARDRRRGGSGRRRCG